jgi:hypothetical protein
VIGKETRAAFYLLTTGRLPALKVGDQWVAKRDDLRDPSRWPNGKLIMRTSNAETPDSAVADGARPTSRWPHKRKAAETAISTAQTRNTMDMTPYPNRTAKAMAACTPRNMGRNAQRGQV